MLDQVVKIYDALIKYSDEFNKACDKVKEKHGNAISTLQFLRYFSEISSKIDEFLNNEQAIAALKQKNPELTELMMLLACFYQKAKESYDYYLVAQAKIKQHGTKSTTKGLINEARINKFLNSLNRIQAAVSLYYADLILGQAATEIKVVQLEVKGEQPGIHSVAHLPSQVNFQLNQSISTSSDIKDSPTVRQPSATENLKVDSPFNPLVDRQRTVEVKITEVKNSNPPRADQKISGSANEPSYNPLTHRIQHYPAQAAGKPLDVANMPRRNNSWIEWISANKGTLVLGGMCMIGLGSGITYLIWTRGITAIFVTPVTNTFAQLLGKFGLTAAAPQVITGNVIKGAVVTAATTAAVTTGGALAEDTTKPENIIDEPQDISHALSPII